MMGFLGSGRIENGPGVFVGYIEHVKVSMVKGHIMIQCPGSHLSGFSALTLTHGHFQNQTWPGITRSPVSSNAYEGFKPCTKINISNKSLSNANAAPCVTTKEMSVRIDMPKILKAGRCTALPVNRPSVLLEELLARLPQGQVGAQLRRLERLAREGIARMPAQMLHDGGALVRLAGPCLREDGVSLGEGNVPRQR